MNSQRPIPPRAGLRAPENSAPSAPFFGSTVGLGRVRAIDRYGLQPEKQRCLRSVFVALTVGALRTARFGTGRRLRGTRTHFPKGTGFSCTLGTALVLTLAASSTAFACPQCFGAEEATLVNGTRLGILVLLGIVLAVQGLFAAFFIRLRNRAKRAADAELDSEWSELQRAPRTS